MDPIKQINIPKQIISGPSIIPTIEPPVTRRAERSVTHGIALPIINVPDPTLNYPVIDVPTQEEFDAAVKAEKEKQQQEQEEKTRGLPDTKPPVIPQVQVPVVDKQDNQNISDDTPANNNLGVPVIEVPIVGEVPIPPKEQVMLAGTTATASVAAALVGKSVVEWLVGKMKPIIERLFAQAKKALSKDLTDYELQLFFAYEHQKKINKTLKKEFKKQKLEQHKKYYGK